MGGKLDEITNILKKSTESISNKTINQNGGNVWDDAERVSNMKNGTPRNLLMVKSLSKEKDEENSKTIQDVILKNDIELKNAYKSKSGNLILECNSADDICNLEDLVKKTKCDIDVTVPKLKLQPVSIVGLESEISVSEFCDLLIGQNPSIKSFMEEKNLSDHINICTLSV